MPFAGGIIPAGGKLNCRAHVADPNFMLDFGSAPRDLIGINSQGTITRYSLTDISTALCKDSAMDIDDAISGRRSVREYTAQCVDEQMILRLINAAILAPNAVNQQPWTFTVVRDQDLLDRISRDAKSHMLVSMPTAPHSDHFRLSLSDPNFQIFYHAPVLILISAEVQGPWIIEDCALAAENLMLVASAMGLGTCWIGFAQGFLNTPEGKKALDLPVRCVPVAPIIVGYPRDVPPPVSRKAPEVRWIG
jgi:nitroreductase